MDIALHQERRSYLSVHTSNVWYSNKYGEICSSQKVPTAFEVDFTRNALDGVHMHTHRQQSYTHTQALICTILHV